MNIVRQSLSLFLIATVMGTMVPAAFSATSAPNDKPAHEAIDKFRDKYKRPSQIPFPNDNPYSNAKVVLGKTLFFDPRLSRSKVMSCATCHNPGLNWTDGNPKGIGDFHNELARKDPTLFNLAWDDLYFWDGRAESLEQQVLGPIQSEHEMHLPLPEATKRLKSIGEYKPLFGAAFPGESDPIADANIAKAIATFMRTIIAGEAPFDRWVNGEENAISPAAKRGFVLFNTKANCASCHSSWRFSDGSFHDIGLNDDDLGRGKLLSLPVMQHAFKTVGLRNIDRRAPYMHNGSLATLEDVIDHYDHGFVKRESLATEIKPLHLTDEEKKDLVAFLKTLTSVEKPVNIPNLPQ